MGKPNKSTKRTKKKKPAQPVNEDDKLAGDVRSFLKGLDVDGSGASDKPKNKNRDRNHHQGNDKWSDRKSNKWGDNNKWNQNKDNNRDDHRNNNSNTPYGAFRKRQRYQDDEEDRPTNTQVGSINFEVPSVPAINIPTIPAGTMKGNLANDQAWYDAQGELETIDKESNPGAVEGMVIRVSKMKVDEVKGRAIAYFNQEVEVYEEKRAKDEEKDVDLQWTNKVLTSGTLADKVAAMALIISDNPLHNLKMLDQLLSMSRKKGRREAGMAIEALKDIFCNAILPDRRLVKFDARPIMSKDATPKHLLFWYFEDEIKERYGSFIRAIDAASFDNLEYFKRSMVKTMFDLLLEKPEQEQVLLSSLVNKLGDPERKLASQVVYLLNQLVRKHPNMRPVVAREVQQLLHRSRISGRAIYYGVIFLNQIILRRGDDEKFARFLIKIYFDLFKQLSSTKQMYKSAVENAADDVDTDEENDDLDNELALADEEEQQKQDGEQEPMSNNEKRRKEQATEQRQKSRKKKSGKKKSGNGVADVEARLLSAILTGVNRAFPYANTKGSEFAEQIDALFKMVHVSTFSTSTQALMLLLQVMTSRNVLSDRFYRALYSKILSPELGESSKQTLFLNVLYKAMKADLEVDRQKAFAKRVLQMALHSPAQLAAGSLYLLSSVIQEKPQLASMVQQPVNLPAAGDDGEPQQGSRNPATGDDDLSSDEEDEEEAKDNNDLSSSEDEQKQEHETKADVSTGADAQDGEAQEPAREMEKYDANARDPLYAKADESLLWELDQLSQHFHPSVQKFALALLNDPNCAVEYNGDPLRDFSITAFLDRFMYRNPKKTDSTRHSVFGVEGRASRVGKSALSAPAVNSEDFVMLAKSEVAENEQFFHKYFQKRIQREGTEKLVTKEKLNKRSDGFDSDDEEEQFALGLAEKLIREHSGSKTGPDDDDMGMDVDFDYSSDEDEGAASDKTKKEKKIKKASRDEEQQPEDDDDSEQEWSSEGEDDRKGKDLDGGVFGSDESDDSDAPIDLDSEDSEGEDESEEEELSHLSKGMQKKIKSLRKKKPSKGGSSSLYATAEDFAEILETAADDGVHKKQAEWEERNRTDTGRKRGRGGRGKAQSGRGGKKKRR